MIILFVKFNLTSKSIQLFVLFLFIFELCYSLNHLCNMKAINIVHVKYSSNHFTDCITKLYPVYYMIITNLLLANFYLNFFYGNGHLLKAPPKKILNTILVKFQRHFLKIRLQGWKKTNIQLLSCLKGANISFYHPSQIKHDFKIKINILIFHFLFSYSHELKHVVYYNLMKNTFKIFMCTKGYVKVLWKEHRGRQLSPIHIFRRGHTYKYTRYIFALPHFVRNISWVSVNDNTSPLHTCRILNKAINACTHPCAVPVIKHTWYRFNLSVQLLLVRVLRDFPVANSNSWLMSSNVCRCKLFSPVSAITNKHNYIRICIIIIISEKTGWYFSIKFLNTRPWPSIFITGMKIQFDQIIFYIDGHFIHLCSQGRILKL